VKTPADAVKDAEIVAILTPDMVQPQLYGEVIEPNMAPGACLLFAHGFNVHYGQITPREDLDVVLVAPKGPGALVRREYEIGRGVPSVYAIHQDKSGNAEQFALTYCAGIGGARQNAIKTTFKEETETDLFGEQTVLCGGASALVQAGFEVLVEAGYSPEMAYFECLHELKLIVDLMNESGIAGMRFSISETAKWGDVKVGPKIIDGSVKKRMAKALKDIQTGKFAKEWVAEYKGGYKEYNKLLKDGEKHPIEKTGAKLRALMPWIKKRDIKAAQASYE
jgi:ketol-acid reductoisomerase